MIKYLVTPLRKLCARHAFWMRAGSLCAALLCMTVTAQGGITLSATADRVELANDNQKIAFAKESDGKFRPTVSVRHGEAWEPLFDAKRPLIIGSNFNLEPTSYTILEDSASRKLVQFHGVSTSPANVWDIAVDVRANSPLIWFQIACHFTSNVTIASNQPTVALWMNQPTATLTLDQGPPSPTGDVYNVPFNFGFPAAYLWHGQKEAAIYFDMQPMTWMSSQGIYRFYDVQIKTQAQGSQTGLGMHPRRHWGNTLRAGEMLTVFYLYSAWRETQPSKFEALDQTVQAFAPLYPANSEFPGNTLDGGAVSWDSFTRRALADFMVKNTTYGDVASFWNDSPLKLVDGGSRMIVHPDRAVSTEAQAQSTWSFSTVNHHLAPWILFTRLNPTAETLEFARLKKEALPRFYDSSARMICSGTRQPAHVFGLEITWQSLAYYQEILQIAEALTADDFNPAILGRMLMGTAGLIQFAQGVNYLFPTYFNPVTKQPQTFQENPGLGVVREPWSVGSYAFVMASAYELTRDRRFQEEARTSLDTLLHTMRYTADNQYFNQAYNEAMDMPVMEVTGNAYGTVAAWKLYRQSGDAHWLRASRDCLNTLLRMPYWYEDQTNAVNRDLRHAGLFFPFVGAACATPWETSEAHLCVAWMLGQDTENPLTPLLLKLSNLNRINSFYFYPATYSPNVRALNPDLRRDLGQYFPIEELYSLEAPGGSTGTTGTAMYMAGNAFWNWWLYEALGEASDRAVLVLNTASLDSHEEALSGTERHLIAFNPTSERRSFLLRVKNLPTGNYEWVTQNSLAETSAPATYSASQVTAGIALNLDGLDYLRVTLRRSDAPELAAQIQIARAARNHLAHAYQLLQERARDKGIDALVTELKGDFLTASQAYRDHTYQEADAQAVEILARLGFVPSSEAKSWTLYQ